MRAVALLLLLPLAACSEEPAPVPDARATAATTPATEPARPTELSCPRGEPQVHTFDYGGDPSFTALLTTWSKELGRPVVDRTNHHIWFVRDDGSAHTRLDWTRARKPANGPAWFVDGYEQCGDHAEWRSHAAASTPLQLEVGHCWIEPVEVGGRLWDVSEEDQFGWGGPVPRRLDLGQISTSGGTTIAGDFAVAGDVATYVDASGVRLTLVPEGDAWALERGGCD